jgi:hypothetical protein
MRPRVIITGQLIDFNRHCKYEFGEYVQTHEQLDNSMSPRTIGALALHPTGNTQGSHYFFSLSTLKAINCNHTNPLPIPVDVIERVHLIALQQKADTGLIFADRNNFMTDFEDLEAHDESPQQSEDDNYIGQWQNNEENSNDIDDNELDDAYFDHNNIFNSDFDNPLQEYVESIDNDDNDQNTDFPESVQHE